YVYVPIIVPILVLLPYFIVKYYKHSARINHLISSLSQGSRDYELMRYLLENRPEPFVGEAAEEVPRFHKEDFKGYEILQSSHIYDLRNWKPRKSGTGDPDAQVFGYRRLKVLKLPENDSNNSFCLDLLALSPKTGVRFPPQRLPARLRKCKLKGSASGEKKYEWQASWDFRQVPAGDTEDVLIEHQSDGHY